MKVYRNNKQLQIVGKVWEIKAKLRELARADITLKNYLELFNK